MSQSAKLYYVNPKLFAYQANVLSIQGNNVLLEQTIFHPQGGGQPSDIGTINGIPVIKVFEEDETKIWHTLETLDTISIGSAVSLCIDPNARNLFSRLHSAGHLIAHATEQEFPELKAIQGHHFPNEARVEFSYTSHPDMNIFKEQLLAKLHAVIRENQKVSSLFDGTKRIISVGNYPATPCGGTHVENLAEIGTILIRNIKHKDGKIRIGYAVSN